MWTADPELETIARQAVNEGNEALARPEASAADAADWLEAVGTLAAMNLETAGNSAAIERAAALVEGIEVDDLDRATMTILVGAPRCATMDEECIDEEGEALLEALRVRDRFELIALGAERLGIALPDELVAARASFDACVAPELWQLVPLGTRRSVEALWMHPDVAESRFWWRTRGKDLPEDALLDPWLVDQVMAVFPEAVAVRELHARNHERTWADRVVVLLPEPIRRRASPPPLLFAAAAKDEPTLFEWEIVEGRTGEPIACRARLETVPGRSDVLRIRVIPTAAPGPRFDLVVHRGAEQRLIQLPGGAAVAELSRADLVPDHPIGLLLRDEKLRWYVGLSPADAS